MASAINGMNLAGFGKRAAAWIIDGIIISFPLAVVFAFLSASYAGRTDLINNLEGRLELLQWKRALLGIGVGLAWLYSSLFERSVYQATPGKRVLGLIVTDAEGNRIDFGRAAGRSLVKFLISNIFGIGYLISLFTGKRQALHDLASGCLVLENTTKAAPNTFMNRGFASPPPMPLSHDNSHNLEEEGPAMVVEHNEPSICSSCGMKNIFLAQFCAKCGRALVAKCPECGGNKSSDTEFCAFCGTSSAHFELLQKTSAQVSQYLQAKNWGQIKIAFDALPQSLHLKGEKGRALLQKIIDGGQRACEAHKMIEDLRRDIQLESSNDQRLDETIQKINELQTLEPDCPELTLLPGLTTRQAERDWKALQNLVGVLKDDFAGVAKSRKKAIAGKLTSEVHAFAAKHPGYNTGEIQKLHDIFLDWMRQVEQEHRARFKRVLMWGSGVFIICMICSSAAWGWKLLSFRNAVNKQRLWDAQCVYALKEWDQGQQLQKPKAESLLKEAAQNGHAWSQFFMGRYCVGSTTNQAQGQAMAQPWLQMAAKQGLGIAIDDLAADYGDTNRYVRRSGYFQNQIFVWANQNIPMAQSILSGMYESGHGGVVKNGEESMKWLIKAAEMGSCVAQICLGGEYFKGEKVQRDPSNGVKWWRKAAEQGNEGIQALIGLMYENGLNVDKDLAEAAKWYRSAAAQGNTSSQVSLGQMYAEGRGVSKNEEEAVRLFNLAAAKGDSSAQYHLGKMYAEGRGVTNDFNKAIKFYGDAALGGNANAQYELGLLSDAAKDIALAVKMFRDAAKQGKAEAQVKLGLMYYEGRGVPESFEEAAFWWRKAAEQGDAIGQSMMGAAYYDGYGVERDADEAIRWCRLAAAQGEAAAQYLLGELNLGRDPVASAKWYRQAAEQGHPKAALKLAEIYSSEKLLGKNDIEELKWWKVAAEQGESMGQSMVGWIYDHGEGVARDEAEAVKWYRLAADQGEPIAKYNLGRIYSDWAKRSSELNESFKWYRMSAECGFPEAQVELADMYANGRGVPKNEAESVRLYRAAAKDGDFLSKGKATAGLQKMGYSW